LSAAPGKIGFTVCPLDTDVLTTKFQDWVDTDILAMKQPWDVDSLLLRDYALDKSVVRKNERRSDVRRKGQLVDQETDRVQGE